MMWIQPPSVKPVGIQRFSTSTPSHIFSRETLTSASGDVHKKVSRRIFVVRKIKTSGMSKDKRWKIAAFSCGEMTCRVK